MKPWRLLLLVGIVALPLCLLVPGLFVRLTGGSSREMSFDEFRTYPASFARRLTTAFAQSGAHVGSFRYREESLIDSTVFIQFEMSESDFARFAQAASFERTDSPSSYLFWRSAPRWWRPQHGRVEGYRSTDRDLPFHIGYDRAGHVVYMLIPQT